MYKTRNEMIQDNRLFVHYDISVNAKRPEREIKEEKKVVMGASLFDNIVFLILSALLGTLSSIALFKLMNLSFTDVPAAIVFAVVTAFIGFFFWLFASLYLLNK